MLAWHHQATATHGFCSDHGERIHLDADSNAARSTPLGVDSDRHIAGVHDCNVLAFLGQSALHLTGQAATLAPVPTAPRSPSLDAGGLAQISTLRLSPSNSPPSA